MYTLCRNNFLLLSMIFSSAVFAISDEDLAKRCLAAGKFKVASQAESYGCTIDISKVVVDSLDNRFLNPSSYVWYKAPVVCAGKPNTIQTLVQYSSGKCDGFANDDEVPLTKAEAGKRCFEAGKAKIAEKAKAFNCSVDYSKIVYTGIAENHAWFQVFSKDCDRADKIVVTVNYYNKMNCPLVVELKDAVETVIQNSAASINSTKPITTNNILDNSRNAVIDKTSPSVDSSSSKSSEGISK